MGGLEVVPRHQFAEGDALALGDLAQGIALADTVKTRWRWAIMVLDGGRHQPTATGEQRQNADEGEPAPVAARDRHSGQPRQ
jgi:hypothetical protein